VASKPSSSSRRAERSDSSSSSSRSLKLSTTDIMREMAGLKAENMEMVKLLAAQLAEVRHSAADCRGLLCCVLVVKQRHASDWAAATHDAQTSEVCSRIILQCCL
jgi:hypothetical protein